MPTELIQAILLGQYDDSLDTIVEAIRDRRGIIALQAVRTLQVGDTVRFSARINPKYLIGKTATVVKLNRESVVVDVPDHRSYGRYKGLRNVRCPNEMIEGKVEEAITQ